MSDRCPRVLEAISYGIHMSIPYVPDLNMAPFRLRLSANRKEIYGSSKPRLIRRFDDLRTSSADMPIASLVRDNARRVVSRGDTTDPHLMFENRTILEVRSLSLLVWPIQTCSDDLLVHIRVTAIEERMKCS
jgi:hypothetical protein